jgi:hypothetical protein
MIAYVLKITGFSPVVSIQENESSMPIASWVGWNGDYADMDAWLKMCGWVRVSFDPSSETESTETFELAKS